MYWVTKQQNLWLVDPDICTKNTFTIKARCQRVTKQPLKLDLGLESIMRAKDVSKNVSQMCLNTLEACGIGGVEGTLLSR